MKKMMDKMKFKPKDIKELVEQEPRVHKVRVVGFSVLMALVAGTYRYWFDMMVARSAQMQIRALAGRDGLAFPDYIDKDSAAVWRKRKTLEVLKNKDFDELLKIQRGDRTMSYTAGSGNFTYTAYAGPNGDPNLGNDYYIQNPDSAAVSSYYAARDTLQTNNPIAYD